MKACGGQVVILGKRGHAEVVGLTGQVDGDAIVVETPDRSAKRRLLAPDLPAFANDPEPRAVRADPPEHAGAAADPSRVVVHDTICRQVSNRNPHLQQFARRFDAIVFVCGRKSSNGKVLYQTCLQSNPRAIRSRTRASCGRVVRGLPFGGNMRSDLHAQVADAARSGPDRTSRGRSGRERLLSSLHPGRSRNRNPFPRQNAPAKGKRGGKSINMSYFYAKERNNL